MSYIEKKKEVVKYILDQKSKQLKRNGQDGYHNQAAFLLANLDIFIDVFNDFDMVTMVKIHKELIDDGLIIRHPTFSNEFILR